MAICDINLVSGATVVNIADEGVHVVVVLAAVNVNVCRCVSRTYCEVMINAATIVVILAGYAIAIVVVRAVIWRW